MRRHPFQFQLKYIFWQTILLCKPYDKNIESIFLKVSKKTFLITYTEKRRKEFGSSIL